MVYFQSSFFSPSNIEMIFNSVMNELEISFIKKGLEIDLRENGEITNGNEIVGKVINITKNSSIVIEWFPPNFKQNQPIEIAINFENTNSGTVITFNPANLEELFDNQENEFLGWYIDEIVTSNIKKLEPSVFGDWITDRSARRPTGENARQVYTDPEYHWPNFYYLLETMHLQSSDYLLEIGCGGGIFLKEALKSGCKAVAIDHSPEMVKLARENNNVFIEEGKLEVIYGDAEILPFNNQKFTCVVMTGVFQFIQKPQTLLKEIFRVLGKNGRLFIYGGSKEMKGTVAAPEPHASRLKFYEKSELIDVALKAGFSEANVIQPDLTAYAVKVGIPEESLFLFESKFSLLLIAKKN